MNRLIFKGSRAGFSKLTSTAQANQIPVGSSLKTELTSDSTIFGEPRQTYLEKVQFNFVTEEDGKTQILAATYGVKEHARSLIVPLLTGGFFAFNLVSGLSSYALLGGIGALFAWSSIPAIRNYDAIVTPRKISSIYYLNDGNIEVHYQQLNSLKIIEETKVVSKDQFEFGVGPKQLPFRRPNFLRSQDTFCRVEDEVYLLPSNYVVNQQLFDKLL